jgi:methionyl-tRNA formyltransferase
MELHQGVCVNIVYFGTSEFAIPPLRALMASRHGVLALVTQPDRARGRKLKVSPPVTKVLARAHGIPVYQPADASDEGSVEYLKGLGADLFIVIAFGQILKRRVLDIPKRYAINLHGSLLPRYRGAAPTNWAIINGDRSTGISIIRMSERLDEGDIIMRREAAIEPDDTNITLSEKLSDLGSRAVLEAADLIDSGRETFVRQDPAQVTYAPKLNKEDGAIDWSKSAREIHNAVRGLLPWPGAYAYLGDSAIKILNTEIVECTAGAAADAGEVIDIVKGKGIVVKTGSGAIAIRYLQIEGGKAMDADAFLRGHRISAGERFNRTGRIHRRGVRGIPLE